MSTTGSESPENFSDIRGQIRESYRDELYGLAVEQRSEIINNGGYVSSHHDFLSSFVVDQTEADRAIEMVNELVVQYSLHYRDIIGQFRSNSTIKRTPVLIGRLGCSAESSRINPTPLRFKLDKLDLATVSLVVDKSFKQSTSYESTSKFEVSDGPTELTVARFNMTELSHTLTIEDLSDNFVLGWKGIFNKYRFSDFDKQDEEFIAQMTQAKKDLVIERK